MGCGGWRGFAKKNTAELSLLGHRVSAPGLWAGVGVTRKPQSWRGHSGAGWVRTGFLFGFWVLIQGTQG